MAFSAITIAWSTRMPIEIAMPASDMMLLTTMPESSHISRKLNSTASGSVTQMTNALPTCIRISRMAIVAMIISLHSVPVRVSMRRWIRRVRS